MTYDDIVELFDLKLGDRIYLSSQLLKLILNFRKDKKLFDGSELINSFQRVVGKEGTILIPVFSFDFSNIGYYDIRNTKGSTGALGNIALERNDFKRTTHPMHSFMVWGKDQNELVGMRNKNSFGIDSPFGYCISHHVKQIVLGTDYVHAMTFIHYCEVTCNVPYRFIKNFTGTYITEDGKRESRTYEYSARKLDIQPKENFNKIGHILEKEGISQKISIEGIESYIIDLAGSYSFICKDIIMNQCRNIYDFNIPREEIFCT